MGYLTRFNLKPLIPYGYNRLIETGSGKGFSIAYALKQGIQRIDSVDATKDLHEYCLDVFQGNPNVHLRWGFSVDFLRSIDDFDHSIIYLDAHFCGGADFQMMSYEESSKHPDSFPLLTELDVLATKDVKSSIIIIDDAWMWFEDCAQKGKCPEWARRWDELPKLTACVSKFEKTHNVIRVPMDEGYIVFLPKDLQVTPDAILALDSLYSTVKEHDIPDPVDLGWNLIKTDYEKGLEYYKEMCKAVPNNAYWAFRYANTLYLCERLPEALKIVNKILQVDPTNSDARWLEGSIYQAMGDLENAWPRLEHRVNSIHAEVFGIKPQEKPLWHGRPTDKTVYIWREQGFGDQIQMLRYIPMIKAPVVVEVDAPLMRLARNSFPGVNFIYVGDDVPDHDYQCSIQSLPYVFQTSLKTIPNQSPYLKASKTLKETWKQKLIDSKLPDGPKIGICWKGSSLLKRDVERSIKFELFAPLADDYTFVSLQYHETIFQDFADTAACMEHLDLILSIDTSVAHLAGAIGKPVWLMAAKGCDARWMVNRSDSPWYPSMRIFRQSKGGDWKDVIRQVKRELNKILPPRLIPADKLIA